MIIKNYIIVHDFSEIPDDYTGWIRPKNVSCYFFYLENHRRGSDGYFYHRLDGPSRVWLKPESSIQTEEYYIKNNYFSKEDFLAHPMVIEHKIDSILGL